MNDLFEKRLKRILAYQAFKGDARLIAMAEEAKARYAVPLSDEEISLVNAAGERPVLESEVEKHDG